MKRVQGRIIIAIFFVFSISYLIIIPFKPLPFDWLIKAIPVLSLSLWVGIKANHRERNTLLMGLLLSAGGDITLAIHDATKPHLFLVGLGLFLLAHVMYIICFFPSIHFRKSSILPLLFIPFFSIGMAFLLAENLGELMWPVFAYISVISIMGMTASLHSRGGWVLLIGALAFILSDAAIAIHTFLMPNGHFYKTAFSVFIMVTYYAAQFLIVKSLFPFRAQNTTVK